MLMLQFFNHILDAGQGFSGNEAPALDAIAQKLGLHQQLASATADDGMQHLNSHWPACLPPLQPCLPALPEACLASQMFNHRWEQHSHT